MLATPELEIARNLPAEGCTPPKPSATRAGWRRITTRISTSFRGCFRGACTSISTICTPTAAGRTIWATRFPIARVRSFCSMRGKTSCVCVMRPSARPSHPVLIALRETIRAKNIPIEAVQRFAARVSARPARAALRDVGRPCSTIACIRRIRWAAWFCISANIATPSGRSFPITHARRCSSRISGRTFRATSKRGASTFRSMRSRSMRSDGSRYRRPAIRRALCGGDEEFDHADARAVRDRECRWSDRVEAAHCALTSKCSAGAVWRSSMRSRSSGIQHAGTSPGAHEMDADPFAHACSGGPRQRRGMA